MPYPFVIDQQSTYDEKGTSVWISQPGSGLDKRRCTLQICITPEDEQNVTPEIIFRGIENSSQKGKDAHYKRVISRQMLGWIGLLHLTGLSIRLPLAVKIFCFWII